MQDQAENFYSLRIQENFYTIRYPMDMKHKFNMQQRNTGEYHVFFTPLQMENIKKAEGVHVIASIRDGNILPLVHLTGALRNTGIVNRYLTLPLLPYSRADRLLFPGSDYGLREFGEVLNILGYKSVFALDIHSKVAYNCIQNLRNIDPSPLIQTAISRIHTFRNPADPVILTPHDEEPNRYDLDLPVLHCTRKWENKKSRYHVPPKSAFRGYKTVLVTHDICDDEEKFLNIGDGLTGYGLQLYLWATHGVFRNGFTELLKRFEHIFTSNSWATPNAHLKQLTVLPEE